MCIKTYKQYFPVGIGCKMICAHKTATILQAYELAEWDDDDELGFEKEDFRPMRLSIVGFKGSDLGDYVSLEIIENDSLSLLESTDLETANYMRILLGHVPNWQLVSVDVHQHCCPLRFFRFNKDIRDGGDEDARWLDLTFARPPFLKLQIDIDADGDHPAETYFITQCLDKISLEYYIGGQRQYHSVIGKDKKGYYELITED